MKPRRSSARCRLRRSGASSSTKISIGASPPGRSSRCDGLMVWVSVTSCIPAELPEGARQLIRRPPDGHAGAFDCVVKMNLGTGPGKQGVGDEDAEAEAAFISPGGKERFAQPVEHVGRESGTIVLDG